jgi:acyl-CoA oxidase
MSNSEVNKDFSARLQSVLDGEFAADRQKARDFISRPDMAPVSPDLSKEEYREKTMGWIREMVEAGFTRLPYDTNYGGAGAPKKYMNMVEVIAHLDMSLAVKQGVQFGLFGMGLYSLGSAKHHQKYLSDIMEGKLLGGFAMTEIGGGSNVQGVETEAVYDHATRSFTLTSPTADSRKAYIGNAAKHGEMMVVFAQLKMSKDAESQGVHAFLVPVRDKSGQVLPGVTIDDCGHKAGLNGIDNGYLSFKDIKLPYDALLDHFARIEPDGTYKSDIEKKSKRFFTMISTLVTGRVFVSIASLSGAKNALASAILFADKREVFGEILLNKQATHARIFPNLATAYALHFATRTLMDKQQEKAPDLETMAAAVKAKSSDSAFRTIDEARLLMGGAGYMSQERLGALRNDVDIFRTFEGDNTILRLLVARNRMSEMAKEFNKLSAFKKIQKAASFSLRDRAFRLSAAKYGTGKDHLLDARFHAKAFAHREEAMLYALAKKIKKLAKKEGAEKAAALCQSDMLAYAEAYAEKVTMNAFIDAVNKQTDPQVKTALQDLCNLFAIDTLRRNALWYVENGYMTAKKTRAMTEITEELYTKIRPNAPDLVRAFGVPEAVLTAPAVKPAQPKL